MDHRSLPVKYSTIISFWNMHVLAQNVLKQSCLAIVYHSILPQHIRYWQDTKGWTSVSKKTKGISLHLVNLMAICTLVIPHGVQQLALMKLPDFSQTFFQNYLIDSQYPSSRCIATVYARSYLSWPLTWKFQKLKFCHSYTGQCIPLACAVTKPAVKTPVELSLVDISGEGGWVIPTL